MWRRGFVVKGIQSDHETARPGVKDKYTKQRVLFDKYARISDRQSWNAVMTVVDVDLGLTVLSRRCGWGGNGKRCRWARLVLFENDRGSFFNLNSSLPSNSLMIALHFYNACPREDVKNTLTYQEYNTDIGCSTSLPVFLSCDTTAPRCTPLTVWTWPAFSSCNL